MRFRLWFGGRPGAADDSRGGSRSGRDGASRARTRESIEGARGAVALNAATRALVERIRAGEPIAFDAMYLQYFDRLWRFAYQYLHSRDAAADLVQDVFTELWVRRSTWSLNSSLPAYLFRAVRNRMVSLRRHEATASAAAAIAERAMDDWPALGTAALRPDDATAANDMDARLRRAIDALTERQRAAVLLRWDQSLNAVETAAVLGVSEAAVRKLLAHARERLRPLIEEKTGGV